MGASRSTANAEVIRSVYAPTVSEYDDIWAPLLLPFGIRLLDQLDLEDTQRVLEIGCGVGRLLPEIERRAPGAVTIGSDLTGGMLGRAPRRFPRVVMDCTEPAFVPDSFDTVVGAFMLFHVPDPSSALRSMYELLRPGGQIGFTVWGIGESIPATGVWTEELDAHGADPDPVASGPPDGEEMVNSPEKLGGLLERAGFGDVRAEIVVWEQRWDQDAFMDWRSRLTLSGRRLRSLDPAARDACMARVRERIASLDEEAFVDRDEVVLATAVRPR